MKEKCEKIHHHLLEAEHLLADRLNGAWKTGQPLAEKKLTSLLRKLALIRKRLDNAYFENF